MPTNRNIVKREVETYASVALDAAKQSDSIFETGSQLEQALSAIRGNMEFHSALKDVTVPGKVRADIIREVFDSFGNPAKEILAVMAERGEIELLSRVCETYSYAAEEETNTVVVDVTTVVELTDELREKISKKVSADLGGRQVVLREHIDKSILGGIVLGAHGKRIDASVVSQLENARVVLSTVPGGEQ